MKKIILILLTPAQQTSNTDKSNDVTVRSKSSAGSQYADNWDAVWGKKESSPSTLH